MGTSFASQRGHRYFGGPVDPLDLVLRLVEVGQSGFELLPTLRNRRRVSVVTGAW